MEQENTKTMEKWNTKCRFFNEKYACDTLTSESLKSCNECKFSSNYDKKIIIIKLGALGDVLRTTPLLEAIKKRHPDSLIYWLTSEESKEILENNSYIDKLLILNLESVLRIQQENFDILYSLEIDTPTTLLANLANSKEKYGYFFNQGATSCFNKEAEEYLETAFLTHKKLENRKTYQNLIFQACALAFENEEIVFQLAQNDEEYASDYLKTNKLTEKLIGINFNAGKRWPSKSWGIESVKEFIKKANKDYKIILLGGKEEKEKINEIIEELKKENISVFSNNPENTISEFAAIIAKCDTIITTDSLALHLATALKKPVIAMFFSTPDWEIESYGRIKKIVSQLLKENFFSSKYSEELANSISANDVLKVLEAS